MKERHRRDRRYDRWIVPVQSVPPRDAVGWALRYCPPPYRRAKGCRGGKKWEAVSLYLIGRRLYSRQNQATLTEPSLRQLHYYFPRHKPAHDDTARDLKYRNSSESQPRYKRQLNRHKMPSSQVYQVLTRYTSEKSLEKKLKKIFPNSRASEFKIKVSSKTSSQLLPSLCLQLCIR